MPRGQGKKPCELAQAWPIPYFWKQAIDSLYYEREVTKRLQGNSAALTAQESSLSESPNGHRGGSRLLSLKVVAIDEEGPRKGDMTDNFS